VCGRKFTDGELVLPVMRYVVNEKRGDFVPMQGEQFAHARHLKEAEDWVQRAAVEGWRGASG
jgi:hypothetical protein